MAFRLVLSKVTWTLLARKEFCEKGGRCSLLGSVLPIWMERCGQECRGGERFRPAGARPVSLCSVVSGFGFGPTFGVGSDGDRRGVAYEDRESLFWSVHHGNPGWMRKFAHRSRSELAKSRGCGGPAEYFRPISTAQGLSGVHHLRPNHC